jgi:hypothetical protein
METSSFDAMCSLQVLTYRFIAFFMASNADKPIIILLRMQIYFLDHVVFHTDHA